MTSKRAIKPLNLGRLQKETTEHRKKTTPKDTKRENDLALSTDVRSMGQGVGVVVR
jgi:hypothetical protein